VQVLLLVWDDTTNNMGLHSGLMATHDQETLEFFKVNICETVAAAAAAAAEPAAVAVIGLRQFNSGSSCSCQKYQD
jgi:hypothetical protein